MNHRTIVLAILLTVAACSSEGNTNDSQPPNSSAASSAVSTTAAASSSITTTTAGSAATSTSTSAPIPPTTVPATGAATTPPPTSATDPSTTVAATTSGGPIDWISVIQTLGQRRQDLYASPDVTLIPEVCGDQSQCADQLNTQIGDLATKGWKVVGADPYVVLTASIEKFDGDTLEASLLVTVVAVIQRPAEAGTIVDSTGSLVANVQAQTAVGSNARGRFLLARVGPSEDPWRIVSQETLPEVPA
jgi:hypothetical protein